MLLTLGVVAMVAGLSAFGVFAAFTATTANTGNQISSGTVDIAQHAGSTTLYSYSNQKPSDPKSSCVRVTYSGSLASAVKLYVSSGITNGSDFNLKVERGSGLSNPGSDMNCTGFNSTSTAYDGALGSSRRATRAASTARPAARRGTRTTPSTTSSRSA